MSRSPTPLDHRCAAPMFVAALLFLLCLAGVLHLGEAEASGLDRGLFRGCLWGLAGLYPLFLGEFIAHRLTGARFRRQDLLCCFLPPLRLCSRDHGSETAVWLPKWGWTNADRDLQNRLERALGLPMIGVALMVLPLMAIEFLWADKMARNSGLAAFVHVGTAVIWLAFTIEFLLMIGVVSSKLKYCKEHWIDVAVICLPLIAFLRAGRLGRLLRLQQFSKTARVYRMRGLAMKVYRALMLIDVLQRLLQGSPEARVAKLKRTIEERERELAALRADLHALEERIRGEQEPAVVVAEKFQRAA